MVETAEFVRGVLLERSIVGQLHLDRTWSHGTS